MTAASAVASTTSPSLNERATLRCNTSTPVVAAARTMGTASSAGIFLLAQAGDVLEVRVALADRDRHRPHALGGEAGDAFARAQVHAADGLGGEADVAAHREAHAFVGVLADVDADDVGARDVGDVAAHRGQHLLQRTLLIGDRDQTEDSVQRAIACAVNLKAERAVRSRCHVSIVGPHMFPALFHHENCVPTPLNGAPPQRAFTHSRQ